MVCSDYARWADVLKTSVTGKALKWIMGFPEVNESGKKIYKVHDNRIVGSMRFLAG